VISNSWRELRHNFVEEILAGYYPEGSELPSVRALAKQLSAHHSTVTKAYASLAEQGVILKRVGASPVVAVGGVAKLKEVERLAFLANDFPKLLAKMTLLDMNWSDLMALSADGC
jgi:GntR family transcriptional regulator